MKYESLISKFDMDILKGGCRVIYDNKIMDQGNKREVLYFSGTENKKKVQNFILHSKS